MASDGLKQSEPVNLLSAGKSGRILIGEPAIRALALFVTTTLIVLEYGFYEPLLRPSAGHLVQIVVIAFYWWDIVRRGRDDGVNLIRARLGWSDRVGIVVCTIGAGEQLLHLGHTLATGEASLNEAHFWWLFEATVVILLMTELWRVNVALSRQMRRPGALLPLSFLTLILFGTPLLMLERAVEPGRPAISLLDAWFTMTSAVCVTGLSVRDTADLSTFGHLILALFIQLGGLGIIIFGSVMAMLLGSRLSLREDLTLSEMLNDQPLRDVRRFVRFIVGFTICFELVMALVLMPLWNLPEATPWHHRFGWSLFHSISAFCNAGFSLQSDSLVGYRFSSLVHFVFVAVIVVGGIGFPVLDNLRRIVVYRFQQWRIRRAGSMDTLDRRDGRVTLHTRITLIMTAVLYIYGVVAIASVQMKPHLNRALQQGQTANQQDIGSVTLDRVAQVVADASFMSVTARTAGFNSMPMDELEPAGQFVVMTLMVVGASPGGTGGGMKTTTLAILLLAIAATVRQRKCVEVSGREIAEQLVRKAATLGACFIGLIAAATFLLSISEPFPLGHVLFESVSAASTTGLSLGITGELTAFGKGVMIVTMFLGRIGPLALLASLVFGVGATRPYRYPAEDVLIG